MAKLKEEGARKYLGFCEISTFLGTKKGTLRFEEDKGGFLSKMLLWRQQRISPAIDHYHDHN